MNKSRSAGFLHSKRIFELLLYLSISAIIVMIAINSDRSSLDKVKKRGYLTVLTRNTSTTYYEGHDGKTGFEYDLARLFADHLRVELKILLPDSFAEIFAMINGGQADIIAAGLTVTEPRKNLVRFGPTYHEITQQLIYRAGGTPRPNSIEEITGGRLEVVAGSSFEERLRELKMEFSDLSWRANETQDVDQLLQKLSNGDIDYTVIDSNEFELSRRFYPDLRIAFDLSEPQQLAWAFRKDADDNSLYQAAEAFFEEIRANGTLTSLLERHYAYAREYKPVETTLFLRHVQERLPPYRYMFIEAAATNGFDWRLLAALAFQESHWITNAVSPTGVRGMMMLTERTAGQMKVSNRLDAHESIRGGAAYLRLLKENLPASIQEPDRTWMALAAYNVGAGHLEDARKITESHGDDPNRWQDVQKYLPLLSKREWYSKTRYGYARGREPVVYVRNIRSYYDILVWLDERELQPHDRSRPALEAGVSPSPKTL
jgi:membrane-bound lytic murein transglycosylase F